MMKGRNITILSLLFALSFVACKKSSDAVKAGEEQEVKKDMSNEETYTYAIDTASIAQWWGYKITDGEESGHNGVAQFKSGVVEFKGDSLVGGKLNIDVNTLSSTDLDGMPDEKQKLDGHLKGEDFLDAAKYPEAKFEITDVKYTAPNHAEVTGNLTMKDVTKSITIPADINIKDNRFSVHFPKFKINRKDWNVNFDTGLKDRVIKDDMNLEVFLEGNKS